MKNHCSAKSSQRGAVLAIFAIGMVAIIALAGLALDISHAYVDKTRMQNLLDATALSGAMTLTQNGNDAAAETAARDDAIATFDEGLADGGEFDSAGMTPIIEFSHTLDPFVVGSTPAIFVRARVENFDMDAFLLPVIGRNTVRVEGSAVAGPVNSVTCRLSPIVVCGTPPEDGGSCNEGEDTCYGYNVWRPGENDPEEECYLKTGTGGAGDDDQVAGQGCGQQAGGDGGGSGGDSDVGPGNFQLLDLDNLPDEQPQCSGGGASFLRCALAKGVGVCPTGGTIPTKPGNNVGPVAQGLNTNFAIYNGPVSRSEYPPDLVTDYDNPTAPADPSDPVFFEEYQERLADNPNGWDQPNDGIPNRRVKPVIIGNCAAAGCTGACDMPILAVGCFYLTQPAEQGGGQRVWGQFIGECGGNGSINLTPSAFTQQKIILYKDPDSTDS